MNDAEICTQQAAASRKSRVRLRLLSRLICLIVAALCLWPAHTALLPVVGVASPFVATMSLLTGTFHVILILGLLVASICLLQHRWFCRWMCPMGLCMDGASRIGQYLKRKPARGVSAGGWLLILTLGGALVGWPLFLWLDPLALFSGIFGAAASPHVLAWLPVLVFAALLIGCILWPNLWCGRLCPSGALQDELARLSRWVCARHHTRSNQTESGHPVARRTVLGTALGLTGAAIIRPITRTLPRPLRPPGAVNEQTFTGLCIRCGNCIRACPYGIIEQDNGRHNWTSALTPLLNFENDYCRHDCTRCTAVCPSGALTRLKLSAKPKIKIGLPTVDMRLCLLGEDRECSACRRWCPYEAIRYVFSEQEYTLIPVIDPDRCNGCGACQVACPTAPVKAMRVLPLG